MTALLITCLSVPLPGCWDYIAINRRAFVLCLGVDPAVDDPQKIRFTIQTPLLSKGASGGQSGGSKRGAPDYRNVSVEAYTLSEAFRRLQLQLYRQTDIAQIQAVVVSGKLPAEMMDAVIGELIRAPKINRLAYLFATPDSAKDILDARGLPVTPADFLDKQSAIRQHGYTHNLQLWQYWRDTTQVGVVPIIPIVRTQSSSDDGSGSTLVTGGIEVYKNNQPLLALGDTDTLYVNFLQGRVRNMALDAPLGGGIIDITDIHETCRLRCITQGRQIILRAKVSVRGTLGKIVRSSPSPIPAANLNAIQSQTAHYLTVQLTNTLKKLQDQQSDIIGFGKMYLQRHPNEEQRIKTQWGNMFQHAKIDVQVNVTIINRGMLI